MISKMLYHSLWNLSHCFYSKNFTELLGEAGDTSVPRIFWFLMHHIMIPTKQMLFVLLRIIFLSCDIAHSPYLLMDCLQQMVVVSWLSIHYNSIEALQVDQLHSSLVLKSKVVDLVYKWVIRTSDTLYLMKYISVFVFVSPDLEVWFKSRIYSCGEFCRSVSSSSSAISILNLLVVPN